MTERPPVILILGQGSLETARRIQRACPGAMIQGLAGRVDGADGLYPHFGVTARELYAADVPLIVLCATGIIIRALAPRLQDKRIEPPVVVVAEDGSAVVPLLGGLRGVNALARRIGAALATRPAITTTGEVRFNLALENPPAGYVLQNPAAGKTFMSDLLAGATVRVEGDPAWPQAPWSDPAWLADSRLPRAADGRLTVTLTPQARTARADELVYHPQVVVLAAQGGDPALPQRVMAFLAAENLAPLAVACLLAEENAIARPEIHAAAAAVGCPLRLLPQTGVASAAALLSLPAVVAATGTPLARREAGSGAAAGDDIAALVAAAPVAATALGRGRGWLAVVGLGPGAGSLMVPAAREALRRAEAIVGYETYVRMAGPFRPDQTLHVSDNREELARARQALSLAATGLPVAVVSSGDPGVFAMAAAVLEALEHSADPAWHGVELEIVPGISAAQAAAARAGAPLGHDFCVISLSDNLKPWPVILRRLEHATAADLVLALYNPISRARPWQLGDALALLRRQRAGKTPVVLGRDIGRPGETLTVTTLAELRPEQVDMRTVVLIGSSHSRSFPRFPAGCWTYAPRWYADPANLSPPSGEAAPSGEAQRCGEPGSHVSGKPGTGRV